MMTLRCVGYQLAGALALVGGTFACSGSLGTSGDQLGVEEEPIIDGAGPSCGGFAGLACPGIGECVDDPRDDCDPNAGGADCSGVCECSDGPLILCAPDAVFDSSPEVCACVPVPSDPCDLVRCMAGTHCESNQGRAECVSDDNPCAAVSCLVGHECVVQDGEAQCVPAGGSGNGYPHD